MLNQNAFLFGKYILILIIKIESLFLDLIFKCINGKINYCLLKKESKYYGLF